MDTVILRENIKVYAQKYKYVVLVLLIGILLMLIPENEVVPKTEEAIPSDVPKESDSVQDALEEILTNIEGAGNVKLLLTQSTGSRTHYQMDEDIASRENTKDIRRDTVLITDASRTQTGLVQWIDSPTYLGAVILCQGAERADVRLAVVDAVKSATGLTTDKITVLKMK